MEYSAILNKKNNIRLFAGFITFIFVLVTVFLSIKMNIWLDEAFSLHSTGSTLANTLEQSIRLEQQAPLYYILLNIWRAINNSIFFARLFSILCIVFSAFFLMAIVRKHSQKWPVLFLCLYFSNFNIIWAATEIRTYALGILISSILLWSFIRVFIDKSKDIKYQVVFIIASVIALYTHYFLGFLLASYCMYFILLRDFKSLKKYLLYMLITGACFAPFFIINAIGQLGQSTAYSIKTVTLIGSFKYVLRLFVSQVFIETDKWSTPLKIMNGTIAAAALSCFIIFKKNVRTAPMGRVALVCAIVICAVFPFFYALLLYLGDISFLEKRYVMFLLPPMILAVFYGITVFQNIRVKMFLFVMILLYGISVSVITFYPMKKSGDWKNVGSFVDERIKPKENIFVYPPERALPLAYYVKKENKIIQIPEEMNFKTYSQGMGGVLKDDRRIDSIVQTGNKDQQRCWFIFNTPAEYHGVAFNSQLLPLYIKENFNIVEQKSFLNNEVFYVSKK
jgi:hypothetical protein